MAPDPQPRRHGSCKGIEPKGLKRWRLSQKHKADPRPTKHKPVYTGSKGGRYWQGPTKRRYDPQPKQPKRSYGSRFRGGLDRATSKIEGSLAKWGMPIGFGLAMLFGVKSGLDSYNNAYGEKANDFYVKDITGGWAEGDKDPAGNSLVGKPAEIAHLWTADRDLTTQKYLEYKFLGKSIQGKQVQSAWVVPFWAGLISWIAGFVAKKSGNRSAERIGKIIEPIGRGALVAGTIGALALPGCPDEQGRDYSGASNNLMKKTNETVSLGDQARFYR